MLIFALVSALVSALASAGRRYARATASLVCGAFGLCAISCARGADGFTPFADSDARASTHGSGGCEGDGASASVLVAPAPAAPNEAHAVPSSRDGGGEGADAASSADDLRAVSADDSGAVDEGPVANDAASASPLFPDSATPPVFGDLAITEVMIAPSGTQPDSEWFEVYNLTASPKLLEGLTIQDGLFDAHLISATPAVVLPPFKYAVIARDRFAAERALVPSTAIVYEYGAGLSPANGIELNAGTSGDLSLWNGSTLLVDVPYGMWKAAFVGQSIELATPQAAPTAPASWCVARSPWASGADDGTPGAANDCAL